MKTAVAETSILQYHSMRDSNELAPKQKLIMDGMWSRAVYSRRQLSRMTGLETSCVAGRCNELIEMGLLETAGLIKCPLTGKTVQGVRKVEVIYG